MSIGIYKYTNKLNGKIYIGLSTNIERRYQQHLYDSEHLEDKRCCGIDYAIKKYGIENFSFEIIEYCNVDELDNREKYWINYYDSYNQGYNRTVGGNSLKGEEHPRAILTEQEVWDIREQYNQGIKRNEVFKKYLEKGITERCLLKVWNHETWIGIHDDVYTQENKELHKKQVGHSEDQIGKSSLDRAMKQDEIDLICEEYKNGMTINAIAKKHHRDNGTILRYINNPTELKKVQYRGRTVQNIETGLIFNSISSAAKWAKCGATTLTRHLATDKTAGTVPDTNEKAHWLDLS